MSKPVAIFVKTTPRAHFTVSLQAHPPHRDVTPEEVVDETQALVRVLTEAVDVAVKVAADAYETLQQSAKRRAHGSVEHAN